MSDYTFFTLGCVAMVVLLAIAARYRGSGLGKVARRYFIFHTLSLVPVLVLVVVAGIEKFSGAEPFSIQSEWRPVMKMLLAATSLGTSLAAIRVWQVLGDREV